jgi:hypothetical protein
MRKKATKTMQWKKKQARAKSQQKISESALFDF